MNLRAIGCNFRTATVDIREKLAFDGPAQDKALADLAGSLGEAAIISTCNRVEVYVSRAPGSPAFDARAAAAYFGAVHGLSPDRVAPHLYEHVDTEAVRHLLRVTASLDSLIVGEGQIAGQVKEAFERSQKLAATGPLLNALFPHALRAAKRVRTETGIARGHISVSSVAVDFVRQVFDHFHDKTVLVIGAGKMGRLTLKHLRELGPGRILVTNRSPEKAIELAAECGGEPIPWENLDTALAEADIALSTTGAPEPIMPKKRFVEKVRPRRTGTLVVLDIAVPRDFDPDLHDGDSVCLFNIDDLTKVRERTLAKRKKDIAPAEAIVQSEVKRFVDDWNRRRSGPVIGQLTAEVDKLRAEVVGPLMARLNGKLTAEDRKHVEGAFKLFQNRLLHSPIAAVQEASREGEHPTLLEAVKKLFRLE